MRDGIQWLAECVNGVEEGPWIAAARLDDS